MDLESVLDSSNLGFNVVRSLGQGGMGSVFEAKRPDGRSVAVKVSQLSDSDPYSEDSVSNYQLRITQDGVTLIDHQGKTCDTTSLDENAILKLHLHGIESTSLDHLNRLNYGNVVGYDGEQLLGINGSLYSLLFLECLDNFRSLSDMIYDNKLNLTSKYKAISQLSKFVSDIKTDGIITHRDIKPDNILVNSEGDIRMIDFGVSKVLGCKDCGEGRVIGTPGYIDPSSKEFDIFSSGMTAAAVFTNGESPILYDKVDEYLFKMEILHNDVVNYEFFNGLKITERPGMLSVLGKAGRKRPTYYNLLSNVDPNNTFEQAFKNALDGFFERDFNKQLAKRNTNYNLGYNDQSRDSVLRKLSDYNVPQRIQEAIGEAILVNHTERSLTPLLIETRRMYAELSRVSLDPNAPVN
jgi:serine/threonine protein kinase